MSLTIDGETGTPVSEQQEGISMPSDYSFATINDFVHSSETHFEELQYTCLAMSSEIERLNKIIKTKRLQEADPK